MLKKLALPMDSNITAMDNPHQDLERSRLTSQVTADSPDCNYTYI